MKRTWLEPFLKARKAFEIIDLINKRGEELSENEISKLISIYANRDYYLPISNKEGSLFRFAIEVCEYNAALFLVNKGVSICDEDKDIVKSLTASGEEYQKRNIEDKLDAFMQTINARPENCETYKVMYEREAKTLNAFKTLKEMYPIKVRA